MLLPENRIPTHPGEILSKEFLAPLGITQVALAAHIGVPVQRVNELVRGKRGVTPDTAWLLAQAFETTPDFWLNLQAAYDLARLHALLLELGRLAEGAGALAAHLNDALGVSYHSGDFAEAEDARQALAAVGALCGVLRRTAGDAQEWVAGIDAELPGLLAMGEA